jgi:hypothetical protein
VKAPATSDTADLISLGRGEVDRRIYSDRFSRLLLNGGAAAAGFDPLWAVTRHADVMEIARRPDRWINAPRPALPPKPRDAASAGEVPVRTLVWATSVSKCCGPACSVGYHRLTRGVPVCLTPT